MGTGTVDQIVALMWASATAAAPKDLEWINSTKKMTITKEFKILTSIGLRSRADKTPPYQKY